jgi:hypothetical protein
VNDLQKNSLIKAVNTLKALKCQFVVITPDGQQFGELSKDNKSKRVKRYEPMEIIEYSMPYIGGMVPGDVCEIPAGKYPLKHIQSRVCSWFEKQRGMNSVTTHQNKKKNVVEVLCIN